VSKIASEYACANPKDLSLRLMIPKQKGRLRAALLFGRADVCSEKILFWYFLAINRPGSDLLSRVLRRSTIGAGAFHGRVRNGNGCSHPAITTRSTKGKNCSGDGAKPNEKLAREALPLSFLVFEHVLLPAFRSKTASAERVANRLARRPQRSRLAATA
jgi:hypothetical protein